MSASRNLIWLASYPKSGNTWFRAVLAWLYRKDKFDINQLDICPIYSSRTFVENECGTDTTELTLPEAQKTRLAIFDQPYGLFPHFFKIHDAYTHLSDGRPLVPSHQTLAALYFIRNPLDVAVSFAYHSAKTTARTIANMNNPDFTLASSPKKYNNQFPQLLLTWSQHVKSWTEHKDFPVHVLRYEDMLADADSVFYHAIVNFLHLPFSKEEVKEAVAACRFENLQKLEKEKGFREKAPGCEMFFRKGVAGDYRNHLTEEEIQDVVSAHESIMKEYHYL